MSLSAFNFTWASPCSCNDDYKLMAKCAGHSGWVEHIDWTLPISLPGTKLHGSMLIMCVDSSKNLLYWNPRTGALA
jgi:microtubule-associated protein-like 5